LKLKVSDIIINKRIREEMGDISILMKSIKINGLINPITVSEKMELLAGFRRLEAVKTLGWHYIECNVVDVKSKIDKLQIEVDENITRKDFTDYEIDKYEEINRYLNSTGLERLILWFRKIIGIIKEFIKNFFKP